MSRKEEEVFLVARCATFGRPKSGLWIWDELRIKMASAQEPL
jgi:hypothetical protein